MNDHPENSGGDLAGEGSAHAHGQLTGKKSLQEILETATRFEQTARDFYTAMIPKVSKRIRYLVEELAAEEQEHYDLFSQLATSPDIDAQILQQIAVPVNDHRFSDCILAPDLGEHPDDQAILQYALYREHAAMEQYRQLADSTDPGPVQDLFSWLANEETRHKRELEAEYYRIIHSGGV
jgi:rubrerythrin